VRPHLCAPNLCLRARQRSHLVTPALVVVDLQRYYLDPEAAYCAYHEASYPGALDYIHERCRDVVVPTVARLQADFRQRGWPVVFLCLCSSREDRSDLIPMFRRCENDSAAAGFPGFYPLAGEPLGMPAPELAPLPGELLLYKTTFSGFNSTKLHSQLQGLGVDTLVITGIVTSLCVETTARDGADHGYRIVMVEDGQSDFDRARHIRSLRSSAGVCSGEILAGEQVVAYLESGQRPPEFLSS